MRRITFIFQKVILWHQLDDLLVDAPHFIPDLIDGLFSGVELASIAKAPPSNAASSELVLVTPVPRIGASHDDTSAINAAGQPGAFRRSVQTDSPDKVESRFGRERVGNIVHLVAFVAQDKG